MKNVDCLRWHQSRTIIGLAITPVRRIYSWCYKLEWMSIEHFNQKFFYKFKRQVSFGVCFGFLVAWLPYAIFSLWSAYGDTSTIPLWMTPYVHTRVLIFYITWRVLKVTNVFLRRFHKVFHLLNRIPVLLAKSSIAYNPVIYVLLTRRYRYHIKVFISIFIRMLFDKSALDGKNVLYSHLLLILPWSVFKIDKHVSLVT